MKTYAVDCWEIMYGENFASVSVTKKGRAGRHVECNPGWSRILSILCETPARKIVLLQGIDECAAAKKIAVPVDVLARFAAECYVGPRLAELENARVLPLLRAADFVKDADDEFRRRLAVVWRVINAAVECGDARIRGGRLVSAGLDGIRARPWLEGSDVTDAEIDDALCLTLRDVVQILGG